MHSYREKSKKTTCVCNELGVGGSTPIIGYKKGPGLMKDREEENGRG